MAGRCLDLHDQHSEVFSSCQRRIHETLDLQPGLEFVHQLSFARPGGSYRLSPNTAREEVRYLKEIVVSIRCDLQTLHGRYFSLKVLMQVSVLSLWLVGSDFEHEPAF